MKRALRFHIECLANRKASVERKRIDLQYLQASYDKMLTEFYIYEDQIERAKRENLDGFDEERFNKKRNNKG